MTYKHKVLMANDPISPSQLDTLSKEGWELVTILYDQRGSFLFYFKQLQEILH